MSVQMAQSNVSRTQKEIADLEKRLAAETKKEADKNSRISQIDASINKHTPISVLRSKDGERTRILKEIAQIQENKARINRDLSDRKNKLQRYEDELRKETERERKKMDDIQRKREKEQLERQKALTRELEKQKQLNREIKVRESNLEAPSSSKEYHFFICHASEDKDEFVRPLAEALIKFGAKVWYDEFQLKVGDSLRRSIDKGLKNSKYGVVILSANFFSKNWPQYELDGLVTKEISGEKVVLPIWHKVSKDEVLQYSPSLADKVALNTSIASAEEIAEKLFELV